MNKLENSEEREGLDFLRSYVGAGVDLICRDKGKMAYHHFARYHEANNTYPEIRPGMIARIGQLQTDDDLVIAATRVALSSRMTGILSAEIGGWYVELGTKLELEDLPERFEPELVKKFYHEVALIAAEEWLHLLQARTGHFLTDKVDSETDIAAYFQLQGIELSLDFITRYYSRIKWYLAQHPERESEVRAFARKYQRFID